MESNKDIGKAFRDKLDHLHKQPGDAVWDSIRADLDTGKKKGIPTWLKFSVIALIILLPLVFTYPLWENHVPRIYMEMPKDNEQNSGTATGSGSATGNSESTSSNEGKVSVTTDQANDNNEATPSEENLGTDDGRVAGNNTLTKSNSATTPDGSGSSNTGINTSTTVKTSTNSNGASRRAGSTGNYALPSASAGNAVTSNDRSAYSQEYRKTKARKSSKKAHAKYNTPQEGITSHNPDALSARNAINGKNSKGNNPKGNLQKGAATVAEQASESRTATPKSAAYQNYRNNTGNGIVTDAAAKDSAIAKKETNNAKIADSLNKLYGRNNDSNKPQEKAAEPYKQFYLYGLTAAIDHGLPSNAGHIDSSLNTRTSETKKSSVYGGYVGFNFNSRLGLRAGLLMHKMEQATGNVTIATTYSTGEPNEEFPGGQPIEHNPGKYEGIDYHEGISNQMVRQQLAQDLDDMGNPYAVVNLHHQLDYFEIPVEVTYKFLNGDFSLGAIGGITTRIITTNTVFAENAVGKITLGSMEGLEKTSFGATLGATLSYHFTPNLQLNAEPVARYYFNNPSYLRSVSYGIQVGVQYNFDMFKNNK